MKLLYLAVYHALNGEKPKDDLETDEYSENDVDRSLQGKYDGSFVEQKEENER